MTERFVLGVKQLNLYVKSLLDGDAHLNNITVKGEISNFKNHYASGHWYFTLKDSDASVRCVMFSRSAQSVNFAPQDGMEVVLRATASLYERDGQYQLYVTSMNRCGIGDYALRFFEIKEKLEKEGLFNLETKRPLCPFPKKIAVVTSDTGAAVKDIFNILNERYPVAEIIMCPVPVQGADAAKSIIDVLERVYRLSGIDAVIIGRGGGSAEDLSVFNDEALARKIYESPFPVISAVGHESDVSICDFTADVRASTPSHAAEIAVPDKNGLLNDLNDYKTRLNNALNTKYNLSRMRFDAVLQKKAFSEPEFLFTLREEAIDREYDKIKAAALSHIDSAQNGFFAAVTRLEALSPLKTIGRGFAAVKRAGEYISSCEKLEIKDDISLIFGDGVAECTVNSIKKDGILNETR